MGVMTFRDARASLKDVMDRVIDDRVDVVVAREKGEAVVIMALEEYNAIQETLHLQKSLDSCDWDRWAPADPRVSSLRLRGEQRCLSEP